MLKISKTDSLIKQLREVGHDLSHDDVVDCDFFSDDENQIFVFKNFIGHFAFKFMYNKNRVK